MLRAGEQLQPAAFAGPTVKGCVAARSGRRRGPQRRDPLVRSR